MYKRNAQGFSKHFDFFILDELSLQIAFVLAVYIRHSGWAYNSEIYKTLGILLIFIDALVLVSANSMHNVVTRGFFNEAVETVKHCFLGFALANIYMFSTQMGDSYSRISLFLTFIFHILIGYLLRITWKVIIKHSGVSEKRKNNMLVLTTPENAEELVKNLEEDRLAGYTICGLVFTKDSDVRSIGGVPVVCLFDDAPDYIVRNWVDAVYVDAPIDKKLNNFMNVCAMMAVPTHYRVTSLGREGVKRFSEKIGRTTVLTTSINYITPLQVMIKRGFDIFAGIIGSIIALIIIAIVGPIIKIKSPGPVLFTQERVGKNGKRFKIIKIRSMYMDAEERKKELLASNKIKDGMMFKMDFDPRIIGNKVLPDGSHKTGIGEFIRKTSLDEFPQFFLVLSGAMSTIGTRPPTIDEYAKYDYHHRARMAIKPGITGLWQVSGRSNITDFEEVVRLDTEYITNWSVGLDVKILFKTIAIIFTGKGAM